MVENAVAEILGGNFYLLATSLKVWGKPGDVAQQAEALALLKNEVQCLELKVERSN